MHYSYAKIVEILVQSAALESTVLLGITILELNSYLHPYDMSNTRGRIFYQMLVYFDCLQAPTAVRVFHCFSNAFFLIALFI